MLVTFTNVTIAIELPDGETDPRIAYAILCDLIFGNKSDQEVELVTERAEYYADADDDRAMPVPDLYPSLDEPHSSNHKLWGFTCLDCGADLETYAYTGEKRQTNP